MAKVMGLNGLIYGKFSNQAKFAESIGWHRQKLNKIINGDKQPSIDEVRQIAEGLGVPFMDVCQFFLN